MKNEVIISANCSKNAFNAKRLIETFCVKCYSLLYVKESVAYTENSIILSGNITLILTQINKYSNGIILFINFKTSEWKKLLHMEYYVETLVKPKPIEIKTA